MSKSHESPETMTSFSVTETEDGSGWASKLDFTVLQNFESPDDARKFVKGVVNHLNRLFEPTVTLDVTLTSSQDKDFDNSSPYTTDYWSESPSSTLPEPPSHGCGE